VAVACWSRHRTTGQVDERWDCNRPSGGRSNGRGGSAQPVDEREKETRGPSGPYPSLPQLARTQGEARRQSFGAHALGELSVPAMSDATDAPRADFRPAPQSSS
jgi:hypothetical protein